MAQSTLIMKDFTLYVSVSLEEIISKEDVSAFVRNNTLYISLRNLLNNEDLTTVNIDEYNISHLTFSVEGEMTAFQLDILRALMKRIDYHLSLVYVRNSNIILVFRQPKK